MIKEEQLFKDVWKTLKDKFSKDESFKDEMEKLLHFYGRKLINKAKTDEQKLFIEEQLEDVVNSQFFQGYYTMANILSDKETNIPNDVWTLPKGIVRNEIPILFNNIFSESDDWLRTDITNKFSSKLIQLMDDVYDVLKIIRKDCTYYGAYKSFVEDSRYQGKAAEPKEKLMLLGNPFDLEFLNPQVYMQAQMYSSEHEIWDLYYWSSITEEQWIGSIHLSKIPTENSDLYILECTLSEVISEEERYDIIHKVLHSLPEDIRLSIQTRYYLTRELNVLVPTEN